MIVTKNFSLKRVIQFTGHHFVWLSVWMGLVAYLYKYFELEWLVIPWLPLSLIGTAVAFYVGFKNNSAYSRMWEARKIWGGIVNNSRSWGIAVDTFVSDLFTKTPIGEMELNEYKKKLIYRQIAWLYVLREQLLAITSWEHASQPGMVGVYAKRYRKQFGIGLTNEIEDQIDLTQLIDKSELIKIKKCKNPATQLIHNQSKALLELRKKNLIDDFRHMELQELLNEFYNLQGKNERIKKFPLPRQYGGMSFIFVALFIVLLPFGMMSEFSKIGEWGIYLSVPFSVMVGWVFVVMEIIGDYSENPFQGMANDIPMLNLCKVIENDLREMLGETNLREDIQPVNGVLM